MKRIKIYLALISFIFLNNLSSQTVSIGDLNPLPGQFGTIVSVEIQISGVRSQIGNVHTAALRIEVDPCVARIVGYNNPDLSVFKDGFFTGAPFTDNQIQFNFLNLTTPQVFTEGKFCDLQVEFFGGSSNINVTVFEFIDSNLDDWDLSGQANLTYHQDGSISAFAPLTSNPAGGDWSSTSAWIGDFGSLTAPGPGHNITIQSGGTITINTPEAKANSITVASGGQLTQQSGDLKVVDFLKVSSGGSFIQNGTITCGDISVEREIIGGTWTTNNDGWHMLSSPMTTQAISGDFTPAPSTSYDFYGWDEAAQTWRNFKGPNFTGWNGSNNFVPGRGYLVAYQNTDTKVFAGTLNSENVTIPVVRGGSDVYVGYNLVGNPYPSAITWGTGWTLGHIGSVAHVWDRATKAYIELTAGQNIPAMNGFMVYLSNAATTSLTIPKAARTHGGTNWYKSTDERLVLVAHSMADGSAQRTVIQFNAEATEDFDLAHDGYFLQGYAPKFYSKSNNLMFSVNTLPEIVPDMQIPLGFVKTESANYFIELLETLSNEQVYLTDTKTNTTVMLAQGGHYQFTATEGDDPDRFLIHFNPVGNAELTEMLPVAFARGQNLMVRDLQTKTLLELFNTVGQLVYSSTTNGSGEQEIGLNLPEGVYVVRLSNGKQLTSTKVFLQ